MSYLADLFTAAGELYLNPGPGINLGQYNVFIDAAITISPPSNNLAESTQYGMPSPVKWGYANLLYAPGEEDEFLRAPGYFSGAFLARTETFDGFEFSSGQDWPGPLGTVNESTVWIALKLSHTVLLPVTYEVTISDTTFTPSSDPASNFIYGAAGSDLIVISLSGPLVVAGS